MFPAFVLLVSKVVLIFDPLGGKPQVVLIFGAVLSLGPVLIFGAGVCAKEDSRTLTYAKPRFLTIRLILFVEKLEGHFDQFQPKPELLRPPGQHRCFVVAQKNGMNQYGMQRRVDPSPMPHVVCPLCYCRTLTYAEPRFLPCYGSYS